MGEPVSLVDRSCRLAAFGCARRVQDLVGQDFFGGLRVEASGLCVMLRWGLYELG
jgi:hypothetical protein